MNLFHNLLSKIVRSRMREVGTSLSKAEKQAEGYWKKLGPGLTTGAADDDPSGIATYSQVGAQYGNQFAWLAPLTYPLMAVVQGMCAKIGLITSRGLAANIRLHYPRWILYVLTTLLFAANTFNIGADLGAMAEAVRLIFPSQSFTLWIIGFTVFSICLQIFTSYKTYASYLKWLALILFTYILTAFTINLDWKNIVQSIFIPHMNFDKQSILILAAVLGTTISPYLFFWQTSQEVEEKTKTSQIIEPIANEELKNMHIDVWSGMFISNLVMFFIIIVCSATLFQNGITNIGTAADAAEALKPLAGGGAHILFAIGIIGTGLLAVPILAGSASYAISESFHWVSGLHHRIREAYAFYGVIIISMLIGLGLNFIGLDPIKALIYAAIANCIVAPAVLIFIVLLSSRRDVMGEYVNSLTTRIIGWIVTTLMIFVAVATCISLLL